MSTFPIRLSSWPTAASLMCLSTAPPGPRGRHTTTNALLRPTRRNDSHLLPFLCFDQGCDEIQDSSLTLSILRTTVIHQITVEPQIQAPVPDVQLQPHTVTLVLGGREGSLIRPEQAAGQNPLRSALSQRRGSVSFDGVAGEVGGVCVVLVSDDTLSNQTSGCQ